MIGQLTNPTNNVNEAKVQSGIDWNAHITPVQYITPDGETRTVPTKNVIYKNTNFAPIGVVGNQYQIYQNEQMWDFIDTFIKSGCKECKIEAAKELKNGSSVIVMVQGKGKEFIQNDSMFEYFVFRNSFDGSTPLQVFFTNIRIICKNTLIAAIKKARQDKTMHIIRHTKCMEDRVAEVADIITHNREVQDEFNEAMKFLISKQVNTDTVQKIVGSVMFPETSDSKRGKSIREKKIDKVLELVDAGMGTEIPGVRGTAYGVYQAYTEWVDHHKTVKKPKNRELEEVKFESSMFSTGANSKVKILDELLNYPY